MGKNREWPNGRGGKKGKRYKEIERRLGDKRGKKDKRRMRGND